MTWDKMRKMIQSPWDVIVVGGGITGAGIFREAAHSGLRCLLIEKKDFGWGTSSRSGKLVHGGLRYLKQGQFKTTFHSVRERERLLQTYSGLVRPLDFMVPTYRKDKMGALLLKIGLTIYDQMAGRRTHRHSDAGSLLARTPYLKKDDLTGGYLFQDAVTDDARLVLRVIQEGLAFGGTAINYMSAKALIKNGSGRVFGIYAQEETTGENVDLLAKVVINATGVWAGDLRTQVGKATPLRRLRGSHIVFSQDRFPLEHAISFLHPADHRPLYAIPWEGATLVGTTDIDQRTYTDEEPRMTHAEGEYLFQALEAHFPALQIARSDALSTFAGIRPVLDTGKADPSKESRDHMVWAENGLVTVTGGKLTTFGLLAKDALKKASPWIASPVQSTDGNPTRRSAGTGATTGFKRSPLMAAHLMERFHSDYASFLDQCSEEDLVFIANTKTLWSDVRLAARQEAVVHLDDLMLRRTRLGLVTPDGGASLLTEIRAIAQTELQWTDEKWEQEVERYKRLWETCYSPRLLDF